MSVGTITGHAYPINGGRLLFVASDGDLFAIGETGSTGLAGGDHLHFTLLLGGVEVNPIEWWDPLWIEQHILAKLPAAGQTAAEF